MAKTVVAPTLPPNVAVIYVRPWEKVADTIAYNEQLLVDALAQQIVNRRLVTQARAGSTFSVAEVAQEDISRSADTTTVIITPIGDNWQKAVTDVRAIIADATTTPPSTADIERELALFGNALRTMRDSYPFEAAAKQADDIVKAVDIRETIADPDTVVSVYENMRSKFTPERLFAATKALFAADAVRILRTTPVADGADADVRLAQALTDPVTAATTVRLSENAITIDDLPKLGAPATVVSRNTLSRLEMESVELSNGVRAAGLMRRALSEALFIARERSAFGRKLVELPLMRRQLVKLMLPTEQARTMVLQTAEALRRSDAGEKDAYALVRILTPLIKFRATRDARKVTGDAMEVRGGCGYIEEWSDPRLLRDAHLGSIWEGTSNIVALDVLRAIRREGSLPVLEQHLRGLLDATPMHADARRVFDATLQRTLRRARAVAEMRADGDAFARQVGSALYHLTTAVAMAWEAGRIGSARRMRLAQLVLRQRVLPQDPLGGDEVEPNWIAPLLDAAQDDAGVAAVNLF